MAPASWWLLGLAAVAAAGDWLAVSGLFPRLARVEYVGKPGALAALLALAATVGTADPARRAWFVVALGLCLVGDVALMLPGDATAAFGAGLGAFLGAQCCFIAGITVDPGPWPTTLVAFSVLVLAVSPAALAVVRAVRRGGQRWLAGPVLVYLGALLVMAATAWSAGVGGGRFGPDPLLAAGALFFVVSDTALAIDRFVRPIPRGTLAVHVTYHLAVGLLVLSLAGTA
jgi:uncharacterized membrane protein YhhN